MFHLERHGDVQLLVSDRDIPAGTPITGFKNQEGTAECWLRRCNDSSKVKVPKEAPDAKDC